MKLPEISYAIFGIGGDSMDAEDNKMLQRIGVTVNEVNEFAWLKNKPTSEIEINHALR